MIRRTEREKDETIDENFRRLPVNRTKIKILAARDYTVFVFQALPIRAERGQKRKKKKERKKNAS